MTGTTTITAHWKALYKGESIRPYAVECQDCYGNAPVARLRDGDECISVSCEAARRERCAR